MVFEKLIPIGHASLKSIATEAIPTYIISQSQKDDASQLEAMSYKNTPLAVSMLSG